MDREVSDGIFVTRTQWRSETYCTIEIFLDHASPGILKPIILQIAPFLDLKFSVENEQLSRT